MFCEFVSSLCSSQIIEFVFLHFVQLYLILLTRIKKMRGFEKKRSLPIVIE